jgi:hypothetical protein
LTEFTAKVTLKMMPTRLVAMMIKWKTSIKWENSTTREKKMTVFNFLSLLRATRYRFMMPSKSSASHSFLETILLPME